MKKNDTALESVRFFEFSLLSGATPDFVPRSVWRVLELFGTSGANGIEQAYGDRCDEEEGVMTTLIQKSFTLSGFPFEERTSTSILHLNASEMGRLFPITSSHRCVVRTG
jgi:hypothetical protein